MLPLHGRPAQLLVLLLLVLLVLRVGAARQWPLAAAGPAAAACAAAGEADEDGAAAGASPGAASGAAQDAGSSACVALALPQGGKAELRVALREPLPRRLPPIVSARVTEHQSVALVEVLGRLALVSRFRRLELRRAWESRTLSGACLRLRPACDTHASVEALWPGLECLVLGRSLFDASVAEDVELWTRVREPDVVVLDEWPSRSGEAALVAANLRAALHPRHTLVAPEPLPRGLCGAAQVSVAGLGSTLVAAHWQREGRFGGQHGQHLGQPCRQSALTRQLVVSLTRHRHARLDSFLRRAAAAGLDPEPFNAVDGRALRLTPVLRDLFGVRKRANPFEDHGLRPGVLGCALSHLAVWAELASDPALAEDAAVLVMEDDAIFAGDFAQRWRAEILDGALRDARWDLLFLGFTDDFPALASHAVGPGLRAFTRHARSFGGGTYGYLIRRRGAGELLALARREGIAQPVDWFMIEAMTSAARVVAFKSSPHLVGFLDVDSQTNSRYPITIDHVCRAKAEAEPAVEQTRSMIEKITVVAPAGIVSRDADVVVRVLMAPGVSRESLREVDECLLLCHRVDIAGEKREAAPPHEPASRCHRLLDSDPQTMLDWRTVNDSSRDYALRAALWSGAALVLEAPVVYFRVHDDWLHLDASGQRLRVVTSERSAEAFLAKHAADQLCVDGRCALLGSLPRSLPGCAEGQRTAAARVTTLAGATLLEAALPCLPLRAPWQLDIAAAT
jgi:GR25 family glycosyltransferase involved in LPS biosynthesis